MTLAAMTDAPALPAATSARWQPLRCGLVNLFVCENPSVVDTAANRLGADCAPLVCTEGQPSSAVRILLELLCAAGIQLVVHADFDWAGLRIAELIARRHAALPWRFRALDHVLAETGLPLRGRPSSPGLDPALEASLHATRRAVSEERLLEELLQDLSRSSPSPTSPEFESASGSEPEPEPETELEPELRVPSPRPLPARRVREAFGCPRRAYLAAREPGESEGGGAAAWHRRQRETLTEQLRQRFPAGRPVDRIQAQAATQNGIGAEVPALFDAVLVGGGLETRVDVLARAAEGWDLVGLCAALEPRARDLERVALDLWIAERAGLSVSRVWIAHPRAGARALDDSLTLSDRTEDARRRALSLGWEVEGVHRLLTRDAIPTVDVGSHCGHGSARPCPFLSRCWPYAQPTLFDLPGRGPWGWEQHRQGRVGLAEDALPDRLTERQRRAARALRSGERVLDTRGLAQILGAWSRPLAFLDFETTGPAVPRYSGTAPYQAVPFLFSCQRQRADGGLDPREYLHPHADDPRPALAAALVAALHDHRGAIVVYHLPHEAGCLRDLAAAVPDHAPALDAIAARLVDLLPAVRDHVYDPGFQGFFSLKRVAPALLGPDAAFAGLPIGEGLAARVAYAEFLEPTTPAARRAELGQALRRYCARDTRVLAELVALLTGP